MKAIRHRGICAFAALGMAQVLAPTSALAAWEPTRPVEFIVPAGTGGGADQMARTIQGIVTKHNLMKQPMVVINKAGGAGGEGFLDVKGSRGNPHKLIITLSNLFTTPLATGIPFNWKDLTPVAMMALDEFVLWVNAETPYKIGEGIHRRRRRREPASSRWAAPAPSRKTRSSRSRSRRRPAPSSPTFRTAAAARSRCSSSAITSIRPSTIRSRRWRSGAAASCVRSACSTASRSPTRTRSPATSRWSDIPTCKSQGLDVEYLMLRGIFMPPGATKDQVDYYVDLLKKVRETPEWKKLMKDGAFNQTFMTGDDYAKWVDNEEKRHRDADEGSGLPRRPTELVERIGRRSRCRRPVRS